jgi:hypothetical protein
MICCKKYVLFKLVVVYKILLPLKVLFIYLK